MNNGIFRSELECVLTEKEIATYSGELARLTQEQAELEAKKSEVTAEYGGKIKACIAHSRVMARKVSSGTEMRDVEVRWDYNYLENVKCLLRLDTGELIDTKALTESERQMCLDLEKKESEEGTEEGLENVQEDLGDQEPGFCIRKTEDVPCTECGECHVEEPAETPAFECQDCRKKKKARICGADCRQS